MGADVAFKNILVPVDGSVQSVTAQELVAFMAKKLKAKVTVFHAVSHEFMKSKLQPFLPEKRHAHVPIGLQSGQFPVEKHAPTPSDLPFPEATLSEITNWYHEKGKEAVERAVKLFDEKRVRVDQKIVEHVDPAEAVIKEANEGNYDLIVIGGSGEEEKEPHLGSIAQKVSRHTYIPTLIAREGRISKMLVPVDGSENSKRALRHAVLLAKKIDAEMTLLHVQESSLFNLRPEMTKQIGNQILANAAEQAKGIRTTRKLESGDPAKTITRIADRGSYDMIVMGSRGHGAIERFLMGSVTDHVIHHTDRSVLIVR